jgi:hypothetical protein
MSHLKFMMSGFGDGRFVMGYANLTQKVNLRLATMQQRSSFLELRKAVADDECTAEQLYN